MRCVSSYDVVVLPRCVMYVEGLVGGGTAGMCWENSGRSADRDGLRSSSEGRVIISLLISPF